MLCKFHCFGNAHAHTGKGSLDSLVAEVGVRVKSRDLSWVIIIGKGRSDRNATHLERVGSTEAGSLSKSTMDGDSQELCSPN